MRAANARYPTPLDFPIHQQLRSERCRFNRFGHTTRQIAIYQDGSSMNGYSHTSAESSRDLRFLASEFRVMVLKREMEPPNGFDIRKQGETRSIHKSRAFMNSRWRDCPIRGTTKLGLRGNETLEGFSPSPLQKNRFRVEQDLCGRGERIRTSDPCVPNAVRYRAALRPDKINRATSEKGLSYITGSKRKPWASATPRQVILPPDRFTPLASPASARTASFTPCEARRSR